MQRRNLFRRNMAAHEMSAGDAYSTIGRRSTTEYDMLRVFDDLRTYPLKPMTRRRPVSCSRLNSRLSRSMPNMAILQGTRTAPTGFPHVSAEVCGIESAPMPAEVEPAEADAPQASCAKIGSPRLRCRASSMPNMAVRFGELLMSEDDSTTASLQYLEDTLSNDSSDRRHRSLWSRTKRFVRRMFCCGAKDVIIPDEEW